MSPGPKRTDSLPFTGWDAFFDPEVQRVLDPRRELPSGDLTEDARDELLAYPIHAFECVDEVVQEIPTSISRHGRFLELFAEDRQFMADLLAAVTRYHEIPQQERSLRRLVAEHSNTKDVDGCIVRTAHSPAGSGIWTLRSWKAVSDYITKALGLFPKSATAERIRKKEYFDVKRDRQHTIERWQSNIAAWRRFRSAPTE